MPAAFRGVGGAGKGGERKGEQKARSPHRVGGEGWVVRGAWR